MKIIEVSDDPDLCEGCGEYKQVVIEVEPRIQGGNELICLNSKNGRNGISGLQPSVKDRIYDADGVSCAITTSQFFYAVILAEKFLKIIQKNT